LWAIIKQTKNQRISSKPFSFHQPLHYCVSTRVSANLPLLRSYISWTIIE
jgi:hypothetical protein